jgi:protoheme IX farnesyltransferase
MVLYALALIPVSLMTTPLGMTGALYFWAALGVGCLYLAASVQAAWNGGRRAARTLLLTSVLYLPLLFAAMLLDRIGG